MEPNQKTGFYFPSWTVPPALFLILLVSFGALSPWLGFYWDDWPAIWFFHLLGPSGFKDVFAIDRPLLGRLFMLTTPLLGESALSWQLFGIFTRWMSCLALWWTLRVLWPQRSQQAGWIAFLFAIYPGFRQQYIAVTYSHGWIILAAFLLSFGSMILALRKPRWFWPLMALTWLLSAVIMFTDEYFFGLELLRPVFLWLALDNGAVRARQRLRRVLLLWLPYLAVMVAFLIWRILLQHTPRGQVTIIDQLKTNPLLTLLSLVQTILNDLYEVSLLAWVQTFRFAGLPELSRKLLPYYLAFVLVTAVLITLYLAKLSSRPEAHTGPGSSRRWSLQAIAIGFLALFMGGWPFWATALPIQLNFPWDRFTLPMMLGACFLFVGILELLVRNRLLKVTILGIIIGLSVGMHFQDGLGYRREWNAQKAFFWQLAWRAPAIKPGTALLTAGLPFTYYTDNSLTGPLNWIYAPQYSSGEMPYLLYDLEVRVEADHLALVKNAPIQQPYRATTFNGSTSQAIVLYSPRNGCLKVLDPPRERGFPIRQDFVYAARYLSDPDNIIHDNTGAAQLPNHIFGPEPEHDWCYYFEKAELARQEEDWQQIARLWEQAVRHGQSPERAAELLPFIEGLAQLGDWDRAEELSLQAYQKMPGLQTVLCSTWARSLHTSDQDPEIDPALSSTLDELKCSLP